MKEETYFNEVSSIIEKIEVSHQVRVIEDHYDKLKGYWEIGKNIVKAQGGKERAKYGNELIKNWGIELSKKYGKNYGIELLRRCRKFYILNIKSSTLSSISWSHIVELLPIKNENERKVCD